MDAVILAGDVSTGRNGLKWALKSFPERPVIYVLGNHEFYGQKPQNHHAPCADSIPAAFHGDAFNPAFASDRRRFIAESGAKLWVHGHLHSPSDYMIGDTRVLANPRGYPTESRQGFQPGLVVEV